jgi:hypothetical protein
MATSHPHLVSLWVSESIVEAEPAESRYPSKQSKGTSSTEICYRMLSKRAFPLGLDTSITPSCSHGWGSIPREWP